MFNLKIEQVCFGAKKSSLLYTNLIFNLHIVYELNSWPHNPTNNFPLKNCLFGTVKLERKGIKNKFTYNGQGIAFGGERLWSFANDFDRNVIILVLIIVHHLMLIFKK